MSNGQAKLQDDSESNMVYTPTVFELSWSDWEQHDYYLFVHTNPNKTQAEFKADVRSLLVAHGEVYLQSEQSFAGANEWIKFIAEKMPELGYIRIHTIAENYQGSMIISKRHDEYSNEGKIWREVVGKELYQKALAHNRKILKELNKSRKE
jgi:hypothetical protein